jgi:hypothetical protein
MEFVSSVLETVLPLPSDVHVMMNDGTASYIKYNKQVCEDSLRDTGNKQINSILTQLITEEYVIAIAFL